MIISLILLLVLGYICGSIPFGVIVAKAKGVNLFEIGSGSTGATNVNRALGKGWAVAVFLLDVTKGVVPTLIARLIVLPGIVHQPLWALVGISAVLGHCFSPFLKFKGGKGIATTLGIFLAASPLVALSAFAVFFLVVFTTRYISLGSVVGVGTGLIWVFVYRESWIMFLIYCLAWGLVLVRHRLNIVRIIQGTEPKISLRKSNNTVVS